MHPIVNEDDDEVDSDGSDGADAHLSDTLDDEVYHNLTCKAYRRNHEANRRKWRMRSSFKLKSKLVSNRLKAEELDMQCDAELDDIDNCITPSTLAHAYNILDTKGGH